MNKDLQIAEYFIPKTLQHLQITEEDRKKYVEWSSQGKHKGDIRPSHFDDGFNALVTGKKYAGINMGLWEEGVMEGTMPYTTIVEGLPSFVVTFMKKEMFKGLDAKVIELCYTSSNEITL